MAIQILKINPAFSGNWHLLSLSLQNVECIELKFVNESSAKYMKPKMDIQRMYWSGHSNGQTSKLLKIHKNTVVK